MISSTVLEVLKKYSKEGSVFPGENIGPHTTFRIGGSCDCMVEISSEEELINIINYLKKVEIPYFILGNGSNLLVSDEGYSGVILRLGRNFGEISVDGEIIKAKAGASNGQIAGKALANGLTGFEFAAGIPGTIGGGVVMNAGAYDGEMKQVVKSVRVLNIEGEILELDNETMEFGYRTSIIKHQPFIVLEVTLKLSYGDKDKIKSKMEELSLRRREKQPLEYPSAGSTFKRPEGNFAGKLIMEAGLKGARVADAEVSTKHCGFIINRGNAKASDVKELIDKVIEKVYENSGVKLEPEVIFLGKF